MSKEKKTKVIPLRFAESEYERIEKVANTYGITNNDMIRMSISVGLKAFAKLQDGELIALARQVIADTHHDHPMLIAEEETPYKTGRRKDETKEEILERLLPHRPEIRKGLAAKYIIGKKKPDTEAKHDTDDGQAANQ